jgi:hypothetical protein
MNFDADLSPFAQPNLIWKGLCELSVLAAIATPAPPARDNRQRFVDHSLEDPAIIGRE